MSYRTLTLFEIRNDNLQVTVGGNAKKDNDTLKDKHYEFISI